MAITVKPGGKRTPLARREERLRHLEFSQLAGKSQQRIDLSLSLRHLVEPIAQLQERINRNQALIIEHQSHSVGHLLTHLLAFGIALLGPGKRRYDLVLGKN